MYLFAACSSNSGVEPLKPAVVFTRQTKFELISDSFTYPGRIKAKVNATVLSESDGIVTHLFVALGKKVKARQVMMTLAHTDPVYQFAPVQILAPIRGIVSSIAVTQGTHVTQGQTLAAVIDPSELEVQVEIPAQDLSVIKRGGTGFFKIPDQDSPFKVTVLGVSPFVDPGTGTALAELDLIPEVNRILSPGMQGQVTFDANQHNGILISDTAVVYKGKDCFVKVVENKKVKQIPVSLGKKQRGFVEVLNGLPPDVQLIERASRFVGAGETVIVEGASTP